MDTLLTLVGDTDPYGPGVADGTEVAGPILSTLRVRSFDCVVLLAQPGREKRAAEVSKIIASDVPGPRVIVREMSEPGEDAEALAEGLREGIDDLIRVRRLDPAHCSALITSGAPGSHIAWMLVAAWRPLTLLDIDADAYPSLRPAVLNEVPRPRRSVAGSGEGTLREPSAVYEPAAGQRSVSKSATGKDPFRVARKLGIRGEHESLREAIETAAAVAAHNVPVLIEGETGTGKGLFARLIHRLSGRAGERFVPVNCGALPEKLVESTLFGHRKGAFTGAVDHQPGKFTLADGGTLFLDEIGELPLELQPKLLRVLDDGVVEPLGARSGKKVDVRILAATHRDLRSDVAGGRFREDLYYRIAFGIVHLPPLRERSGDIPLLALHLLDRINASLRTPKRLTPEALIHLERQPWHGNVRDLENVIGRSVLLCAKETLDARDLVLDRREENGDAWAGLPEPHDAFSLETFLADARRSLMNRALEISGGNQSAAARKLGLSPQAVHKFLQSEQSSSPS